MNLEPPTRSDVIAIFVHVHYPDIWHELSLLIAERVDLPFKLIVTTSQDDATIVPPSTAYLTGLEVMRIENRGRDILPFMRALATVDDFDVGLKLHTKKSPQRTDGSAWRNEIFQQLMPADGGISAIVAAMRADPRVGFVAPDGFSLSVRPWVFGNGPAMKRVMAACGHEITESDMNDAFFAAGSMFWFRREGLAAFAGARLPLLFEPEQGQLDGTIAHAIERVFPIEIRRRGLISTSTSALMAARPGASLEEVIALARQHADIPNVYFPAAGVAAGQVAPEPPTDYVRSLLQRWAQACPPTLRRLLRKFAPHRR